MIHRYRYDRTSVERSLSALLTGNDPLEIVNGRDKQNREAIAYTPDGAALYTVSEHTHNEAKEVNVYNVVTDMASTADVLYGGPGSGIDWYVGIDPEAKDNSDTKDLVLGTMADVNFNGIANALDVDEFVDLVTQSESAQAYYDKYGIGSYTQADMNGDGEVNGLDVDLFVAAIISGSSQSSSSFWSTWAQGDVNGDGSVDLLDVTRYIEMRIAAGK